MGTDEISRPKTYACCVGIARLNVDVAIYVEAYIFSTPIGIRMASKDDIYGYNYVQSGPHFESDGSHHFFLCSKEGMRR